MSPARRSRSSTSSARAQTSTVEVTLKDVKEKILPPLDDDLARSASEFDTLAELRADIEQRIREQIEEEVETEFRAAAADALVEASKIQPSGPLVEAPHARARSPGSIQSLERRGISLETYVAVTNQTPAAARGALARRGRPLGRPRARARGGRRQGRNRGHRRRGTRVHPRARRRGGREPPTRSSSSVFASGRHELLRDDLRMRKALDLVVAEVERIPLELAEAREKLWTPEKGAAAPETKLWTPGSKE